MNPGIFGWSWRSLHVFVRISLLHLVHILPYATVFMSFKLLCHLKRNAATVSRVLYMFVTARMELAGWIGSLAELHGTADCHSKISVATNNIDKFHVIVCYACLILHDSSIICISSSMMDSKNCSALMTLLVTTTEYGMNYLPILCPLPEHCPTRSCTPMILWVYQQAITLLPLQPTLEVWRMTTPWGLRIELDWPLIIMFSCSKGRACI